MRLRKQQIEQRINSDLKIEFAEQSVSGFSGLELVKRYFRLIRLNSQVRRAFQGYAVAGDYSVVQMILVMMALWLTGGRRLKHIPFIGEDPLVKRLCGLKSLPSDRTVSRWLSQFTIDSLQALVTLNSDVVTARLKELCLPRVTLGFDGTVLSCGDRVKWASRGYNPQNRHSKSLYPLLVHVAQTGQFLKVLNRPGDMHDSKRALEIIKASVAEVRQALPNAVIEARLDAAFFNEGVVKYLLKEKIEFAIKVPMWDKLDLKWLMVSRQRWSHATSKISWFKSEIALWDLNLEMTFYRIKISETLPKIGHQLDFFTPDDGTYEHQVIFSNKNLEAENLLDFYNGRCAMEHDISEIKGEFGFDVIPCRDYQGNGAHQQISVLAHNLMKNFQMDLTEPAARSSNSTRTNIFEFKSLKTLRFELITAAGRLVNLGGYQVLRLTQSVPRCRLYEKIQARLSALEFAKKQAA